jgi:hypothetical protein
MIHRPSTISGNLFALLVVVTAVAAAASVSVSLFKAGPVMWGIVGTAIIGSAIGVMWTRHMHTVDDAAAASGQSFIGHTLKNHDR